MKCIFCDNENDATSVEHIVPESFGNTFYTLDKSTVCDACNNSFSGFEGKALTNSIFAIERARLGVITKKGKSSKGKVSDLIIEGDENFRKTYLTIRGINKSNLRNFNAEKGTGELVVPAFDKSEVATSKLLLSVGLESLYKSKKKVFEGHNFSELKDFIIAKENKDWPFTTSDFSLGRFYSVPTFYDKYRLKKIHCRLTFCIVDSKTLLFRFSFGGIAMTINLLNRDLEWLVVTAKNDEGIRIYPEHYRKKLGIKTV